MYEGQAMTAGSPNVDRVLYNDLVQIVPLVQSFIDRKENSSFSRRGSVIYTKTPSRDSKKKDDSRNKNAVKSTHRKKQSDKKHGLPHQLSASSVNMAAKQDTQELRVLREELEDLRRKLVEKDELLKSAEASKNQKSSLQSQVDELKHCVAKKDSVIKTTQQQLNDAKIQLADKQASLEKLQWEAKTSDQKVEKLREELNSTHSQVSSLMLLFEGLSKDQPIAPAVDYDTEPLCLECLPEIDDMEESEMQKMEEATQAYLAALAIAKETQDEESLAAAARARLHLQSFVFKSGVWTKP